jgi:hypothetical protein
VRIETEFRKRGWREDFEEPVTLTDVGVNRPQRDGLLPALLIHHVAIRELALRRGQGHHTDAPVQRKGPAPMAPVLRLARDVLDDLCAGQVRRPRVEAELANELDARRLVRLAREPRGARTDGLRCPPAGPELVALGNEVFRPDVKASRRDDLARFGIVRVPVRLFGTEIQRILASPRVFQHAPANVMTEHNGCVSVGKLDAIGIVQELHAPDTRWFRSGYENGAQKNDDAGVADRFHDRAMDMGTLPRRRVP